MSAEQIDKMNQAQINKWVISHPDPDMRGLDAKGFFIAKAVDCWVNKDAFGFIRQLKLSTLNEDQIVCFAMRQMLPSEEIEVFYWADFMRYLNNINPKFYP